MKFDNDKDDHKEYKPYWWVYERLKMGFFIFVFGAVCFGVYKLMELIYNSL